MNSLVALNKVTSDEEQLMHEIVSSKGSNLPATIEDVINVFEFTDFKAKAWKILAGKMSKLDEQSELYHSALRSGQQWGIASLYAQKRMGEITRDMPTFQGVKNNLTRRSGEVEPKQEKLKSKGIDHHTYQDAEKIANNPEILDRVIESAKKRDEIPTKRSVLNVINVEAHKKVKERDRARSDKRIANEKTQAVKDYYDVMKGFKAGVDSAIISAKYGDFAPEGKNFLIKKHNELKNLMDSLEALI